MSTILTFPTVANPSTATWRLKRFDGRFTSPLSGQFQDMQRPGAQWQCDLTWQTLTVDDSAILAAWADQMAQAGYRTFLPNFAYKMRGSASGSPTVSGASQTGSSLTTAGWTASAAGVLKAGDLVEVTSATQHQLLRITADASADSSGDATLSFTPPLRFSPTNAGAIVTATPKAAFAFSEPQSSMSYTPPILAAFSCSLVEDINL